jgi:hypothetical protein
LVALVDCRRSLADAAFVADDCDYRISIYAEYRISAQAQIYMFVYLYFRICGNLDRRKYSAKLPARQDNNGSDFIPPPASVKLNGSCPAFWGTVAGRS